jgi:hypothetical protein
MQGLEALDQFKNFVSKIGGLGRYEDTYIVHAAEGETVVPMEVLDKNPLLKKRLFKTMMEMGIEPGRYIVGNELNSKNPVTGQPEFFLKKIGRRLRKAAADISGYAAPVIGAMYGPVAGAAAGALLGQYKRENPGDPTQGLNMALLGGGTGLATNFATGATGGLRGAYGMDSFNPVEIGKAMMGKTPGTGITRTSEGLEPFKNKAGDFKIMDKLGLGAGEAKRTEDAIDAKKSGLFGDMSLRQLASLYGLGTVGLGLLIKATSSDDNVGDRRPAYQPTGKKYEGFLNPRLDFSTDMPIVNYATGGGVMDLQDGGESVGPGTGTSDSIPAMLSDGEFVMTAKAVRGAGGGDRREGARKMYEAMDKLEAKA